MAQLITYADKTVGGSSPTKDWQADDANEVKSIINKILGHELTTGVLNGGGTLVPNADTTKFDITDGQGYLVDLTNPNIPTYNEVTWSGKTGITPTFASSINSRIYIDVNGDVQQQLADFSCQDMRQKIVIGVVTTQDTVNVSGLTDESHDVAGSYLTSDMSLFLDVMSSGNLISPNGANLSLNRGAGETYQQNINRDIDALCPNIQTDSPSTLLTFNRIYSNGSGGFILELGQTTLNVDQFDDGSGTLQTLSPNRFQNQYVYYLAGSGLHVAQYGEKEYQTIDDAKAEAKLVVPSPLGGLPPAQLRAIITVKKGVTDLAAAVTGAVDAFITPTGKFGFI